MTDTLPDRLSTNPNSPFYNEELLKRDVGIRFKGVEKTNVEEYCISEGWIRVAAGTARDRARQSLDHQAEGYGRALSSGQEVSGERLLVPRAHQLEARDAIPPSRRGRRGKPGFLLGDLTGLGKTLSAWLAVAAMPEDEVLVICPKGAIPQWRRTIARSGLKPKSVTLMNFEKTKSLMAPPPASSKRSTRAKNNEPRQARHAQAHLAAAGDRREPPHPQPQCAAGPGLPADGGGLRSSRSI